MKREFYVGYLKTPSGIKRGLLVLVPLLLVSMVVVAALVPAEQDDPGTGTWDLDTTTELTGVVLAEPYPQVLVAQDGGGVRTVLLASQVKSGVHDRVTEISGQTATVRGNLIERDGRALMTLLDDASGVEAASALGGTALPTPQATGRFELTGQIIDPKCYLGAMKPGEGKIHKACATLCIKGGVPPMFMTRDADDQRTLYLLTGANGEAVFDSIERYIADPITAEGVIERHGDLAWFKIDAATIARLE